MERRKFATNDHDGVEWHDRRASVIIAQVEKVTGKALISFGLPLVSEKLTEAEAIDLADAFAPTVAILFSNMRAHLARRRAQ